MKEPLERLTQFWHELYDGQYAQDLEVLVDQLKHLKTKHSLEPLPAQWFKDVVVYSLYVDLFNNNFEGLIDKLDYLQDLGITCLWLLPILDSPMRDAGFDIRDYEKVRDSLVEAGDTEAVFDRFIHEAHKRGIYLLFDVALNHASEEHAWFKAAKDDKASPYRDYFIWSDTDTKYADARIIFKGMMNSNWSKYGSQYYFHRFFDSQPDLNYRNPKLLKDMTMMLMRWLARGVDSFRADAIPYLWKEEGTNCENLPKTHTILKLFRAAMDYMRPGSILLAEANQPPLDVANYFGEGDECLAAYHFPLMPRIYRALAEEDASSVKETLHPSFTPPIPINCQWFSFLRCHDELTLEMVSPDERQFLYNHYAKDPLWDFREGEGISARLASLLDEDPKKITLLNSILLSLLGTPVIYYGDELGKTNDRAFYEAQVKQTGYKDSRYLVRGSIDWRKAERDLKNETSLASQIFYPLKKMLSTRAKYPAFSRGTLTFSTVEDKRILAFEREFKDQAISVFANLSDEGLSLNAPLTAQHDLLEQPVSYKNAQAFIEPLSFYWLMS